MTPDRLSGTQRYMLYKGMEMLRSTLITSCPTMDREDRDKLINAVEDLVRAVADRGAIEGMWR